MLKKILIGAGVLVALLVVGVVALVLLVDVNRFKPELVRQVKERYDRTLVIDGDLALKLFPRVAVALPRTTLSVRGGTAPFAGLEAARVSVAVLPLLSKRIEVDQVALEGLTATVTKRKDGSTDIDDLLGGPEKPAAPADAKAAPSGPPPSFRIGGIALTRASLTLNDEAAGRTVTLAPLNLTTGELANRARTPVSLDGQFSVTKPAARGSLNLKATADIDLPARAYGAEALDAVLQATVDQQELDLKVTAGQVRYAGQGGLSVQRLELRGTAASGTLQLDQARVVAPALAFDPQKQVLSVGGLEVFAKGRSGTDTFDATVSAPKVEASADHAAGDRVLAGVKLGGARTGEVKLTAEGFGGNAQRLSIDRLAVALDLREGQRHLVGAVSTPASASIEAQTVSLPKLTGELTVADPSLPVQPLKLPLTLALAVDAKKETVDAHFTTKVEQSTVSAEVDVRGFSPPHVRFDASADKLDLDRYVPPPKPGPGNDSGDPKEDPKVDLSALKGINANGQVRIGQLKARGVRASNLLAVVKVAGGKADLAPFNASLYGGTATASAHADAHANAMRAEAALTGVSIAPLLKDLADKDILEGKGNVRLNVATGGATVGAMKRALDGTAAVNLRDGAIKGINVAQKIRDAQALLGKGGGTETHAMNATEKTDFSELNVTARIDDGVATSDDLDLKSPLLRVSGAGKADIGASTVDYVARVSVVGTLKGQDGRDLTALRGVTIPIHVSGPFDKLAYGIDWTGAAQEALKSKAAEQLKEKLQPQVQQQRDRLKDAARNALKGLVK